MRKQSCYTGLPETLKVGPFVYEVILTREDASSAGRYFGAHNYVENKILVSESLNPQQLANTFMHEVVHALHSVYSIHVGGENGYSEEEVTTMTATALCALWQDNPSVMGWWNKINSMGIGK